MNSQYNFDITLPIYNLSFLFLLIYDLLLWKLEYSTVLLLLVTFFFMNKIIY